MSQLCVSGKFAELAEKKNESTIACDHSGMSAHEHDKFAIINSRQVDVQRQLIRLCFRVI